MYLPRRKLLTRKTISLQGFLPLSGELATTRGQAHPSLLSGANLSEVWAQLNQRRSSTGRSEPRREPSYNANAEANGDVRQARQLTQAQRTVSDTIDRDASSRLAMTPQMRSMRLIGNNVCNKSLPSDLKLSKKLLVEPKIPVVRICRKFLKT